MGDIFRYLGDRWSDFLYEPLTVYRVAFMWATWGILERAAGRAYKAWYRRRLRQVMNDPQAAIEFLNRHDPPKR